MNVLSALLGPLEGLDLYRHFVFVFVLAVVFVYLCSYLSRSKYIMCVRLGPLEGLARRSSTSHLLAKRG